MPTKEILNARKLIRSQQITDGKTEWLRIRCNINYPKDTFLTKSKGYRLKCKTCSEKETAASIKYRKTHAEKFATNSRFYEERRKKKRQEVIQKHREMVSSGCDTVVCTKCKEHKPIDSFRSHTRKITSHCYECRQYQHIIEYRRGPDTRERRLRQVSRSASHYLSSKYCAYRAADMRKHFCESKEEFEYLLPRKIAYHLMSVPCTYCGFYEPGKIGLDRVDPIGAHTLGNVVSCCETCNVAKNNLTLKQFVTHIERIHNHLQKTLHLYLV